MKGRVPIRAAGEGAFALAPVAGPVHPALFQAAAAQDAHVFLAQRRHALADPVHGLVEGHDRLGVRQRGLDVVDVQALQPERLPAQPPVAVPGGQVVL